MDWWCFVPDPINTFHSTYKTDNEPIRISYHQGVHYNSVVDPYKATIGVGLGLPGYQPGVKTCAVCICSPGLEFFCRWNKLDLCLWGMSRVCVLVE